MSENLAQMVKENKMNFSTAELDTPNSDIVVEAEAVEVVEKHTIEISSLSDWFTNNVETFPNLRKPTVSISGVDPNEQLIVVLVDKDTVSGNEKNKLTVFDNATEIPVLNIPPLDMQIFNNNSFRIIYDIGEGIFIKTYNLKKTMASVFCYDVDDLLIPYAIQKCKKSDSEIDMIYGNQQSAREKLSLNLDVENFHLKYKQSAKVTDLTTNLDAVKWLIERQGSIEDVNHHLQIDTVIIDMLS